jgi:pimeloyl-ACP methyl ester carboxylesterase
MRAGSGTHPPGADVKTTSQRWRVWRRVAAGGVLTLAIVCAAGATQLPSFAAGVILHPIRMPMYRSMPEGCTERAFPGAGITLAGWQCRAVDQPRATLVYLHGISDNRASGVGIISRFTKQGYEVIAYDSRGHGASGGDVCTYGHLEKLDLQRVIAAIDPGPIVLLGSSLGAAVALQAAVQQPRVTAVVAAEVFSDLYTVARDRVPVFLPDLFIRWTFRQAERRAHFETVTVSPAAAARRLTIPVFLIHGAEDVDTPPDHSRRVYAALQGPKRLILVDRVGHNRSLSDQAVWTEIDAWLEAVAQPTGMLHVNATIEPRSAETIGGAH